MKTRQTSIRELEQKLKLTLYELQKANNVNKTLLQEREEGEAEIKNILDKNSRLKNEMLNFESEIKNLRAENEHLMEIVHRNTDRSSDLNEAQLKIKDLQYKLNKALALINCLDIYKNQKDTENILSLYNEIVSPKNNTDTIETIDLTSETNCPMLKNNYDLHKIQGRNQLKKYLKVKRMIRKCKKHIKYNNRSNVELIKDKMSLKEIVRAQDNTITNLKLECNEELEKYTRLENNLKDLNSKYDLAQNEIEHLILATNILVGLSPQKKSQQLLNKTELIVKTDKLQEVDAVPERKISDDMSLLPAQEQMLKTTNTTSEHSHMDFTPTQQDPEIIKTIEESSIQLFCDEIGAGFGDIFSNIDNGHIMNTCVPNIELNQLIDKITSRAYEHNTNVVIMMGNTSGITKNILISCIESLMNMHKKGAVNKILFCTFPYLSSLSEAQNQRIHSLNVTLYNLISSKSQQFLFFDINNLKHNFSLIKNKQFLARHFKIALAKLILGALLNDQNKTKHEPTNCNVVITIDTDVDDYLN